VEGTRNSAKEFRKDEIAVAGSFNGMPGRFVLLAGDGVSSPVVVLGTFEFGWL
jgi:hypothetical protein